MKPVSPGTTYSEDVMPRPGDLASDIGNAGVDVVSSPATIGYLEIACHRMLEQHFEADEASVGVGFRMTHRAAAFPQAPVNVSAELISSDGRLHTFQVVARQNGILIMDGEHDRAIVNLTRFLARAGTGGTSA